VAVRKNTRSGNQNQRRKPVKAGPYLFWLVFLILILLLFIVNWKNIRDTVQKTRFFERMKGNTEQEGEAPPDTEGTTPPPSGTGDSTVLGPNPAETGERANPPPDGPESRQPTPAPPAGQGATEPQTGLPPANTGTQPEKPAVPAADRPANATGGSPNATGGSATAQKPAETTPKPAEPSPKPGTQQQPAQPEPPKTVQRSLCFVKVTPDGAILAAETRRGFPVSDSPMLDVLNYLLMGPTAAEERQGLISLIPPGTRIISPPRVQGSTAYVNFSEEFEFNTYSVEGYVAQLRQIVWTITQFSNVKDVQILIEGRRIDYLAESIWIGSPIDRNSF
jgi:spore germination protein GerM